MHATLAAKKNTIAEIFASILFGGKNKQRQTVNRKNENTPIVIEIYSEVQTL
jgi:hypothetical protein